MSRIGETICLALNSIMPRRASFTSEGQTYSEAEFQQVSNRWDFLYGKHNISLPGKTVLDAGCGPGGKTAYYALQGCRFVYGVDREPVLIEQAKCFLNEHQIDNAEVRVEDLAKLRFESNTFDVIFLNGVLEHIVREKLVPALAELKRVLKPGGYLLLEFPPWSAHYAAHLYDVIYIPWCHYLFSDETLIDVANRLYQGERKVSTSYTEHFMELNRCSISEFRQIVQQLEFDVIQIYLEPVKKMSLLPRIPIVGKFFVHAVDAVLSKTETCPEVSL